MIQVKNNVVKIEGNELDTVKELGAVMESIEQIYGLKTLETMIKSIMQVIERNRNERKNKNKDIKKIIRENVDKDIADILCNLI